MPLIKDKFGFIRSRGYGTIQTGDIAKQLNKSDGEAIYHTTKKRNVRTSKVVRSGSVKCKPGDTFVLGPQITKAGFLKNMLSHLEQSTDAQGEQLSGCQQCSILAMDDSFEQEARALKRAGFGAVSEPEPTEWGWALKMNGVALPGGKRTNAMVLLPKDYPLVSPIGFYLKDGAYRGGLDESHLYNTSYHEAPDLSQDGWQWFCGIAEGWVPGKHNLVTYISMVFAMLAEKSA